MHYQYYQYPKHPEHSEYPPATSMPDGVVRADADLPTWPGAACVRARARACARA